MKTKDYIYLRHNPEDEKYNVLNLGQTFSFKNCNQTYKTGEFYKCEFVMILEITDNY